MKDLTPRQETTAVKKALINAGFDKKVILVGHGRGTAAAWLEIRVNQIKGRAYNGSQELALSTVQGVTGRHGDYDGQITVTVSREAGR